MDANLQIIFVVINAISLLLLIYLWRLNRKRYSLLKKLVSMRSRIARDLHDDIGATLSSISFYGEAAIQRINAQKTGEAIQVIDKMGVQSRSMIENMNDIVWMVNPKNDRMDLLLEKLEDYGRQIFTSKGIQFMFYADPQVQTAHFVMDVRKDFYLICKEAMNNAAKYSQCKSLEVLIKKSGDHILTIIKDDGIGFNPDGVGNGNGLLNMKVRAGKIGDKLKIDSNIGRGTAISFQCPYPPNW